MTLEQFKKDYPRLLVMAKQARRNPRTPEARDAHRAIGEAQGKVDSEIYRLQREKEKIDNLAELACTPIAELHEPLNPPEGYAPVAVFSCGDVTFYYENISSDSEIDVIEMEWPFKQKILFPDDCIFYGMRVEQ
jgi:hypothetical protein